MTLGTSSYLVLGCMLSILQVCKLGDQSRKARLVQHTHIQYTMHRLNQNVVHAGADSHLCENTVVDAVIYAPRLTNNNIAAFKLALYSLHALDCA